MSTRKIEKQVVAEQEKTNAGAAYLSVCQQVIAVIKMKGMTEHWKECMTEALNMLSSGYDGLGDADHDDDEEEKKKKKRGKGKDDEDDD